MEVFKVSMSRHLDTSPTTQMFENMVKHWRSNGSSRTKFVRTPVAALLREKLSEKFCWTKMGRAPNWWCVFAHRQHGLFLSEKVDDTKTAGRQQNMSLVWKKLMKEVDLGENQHHFLTMCTWDVLHVNAIRTKLSLTSGKLGLVCCDVLLQRANLLRDLCHPCNFSWNAFPVLNSCSSEMCAWSEMTSTCCEDLRLRSSSSSISSLKTFERKIQRRREVSIALIALHILLHRRGIRPCPHT